MQPLPLSVVKEFKKPKCRAVVMYSEFTNLTVRGKGVTTRSGCKCAADTVVSQTESLIKLINII